MIYFKAKYNGKTLLIGVDEELPSYAEEITKEEYDTLMDEFETYNKNVEYYVDKILINELMIDNIPLEYKENVIEKLNEIRK